MSRLFPMALKAGDEIAVLAPASGGYQLASLQRGIDRLRHWGFRPTLLPHAKSNLDWPEGCGIAATDEQRCQDLQQALATERYRAIACTRGGYGSARILQDIDWTPLRRDPKPILGYSDITALLLAAYQEVGLIGFHGPMVATNEAMDAGPTNWELQRRLLTETSQAVALPVADGTKGLCTGEAEGPLLGGNLSLVQSLVGTPWQIEARDSLLFLEDTGEAPYRVDRMLTQLLQAGVFEAANGVVLGDLHVSGTPLASCHAPMLAVVEERLSHLDIPIAHGFPIGHMPGSWTLPFGVRARLRVPERGATASLELLEPAVC